MGEPHERSRPSSSFPCPLHRIENKTDTQARILRQACYYKSQQQQQQQQQWHRQQASRSKTRLCKRRNLSWDDPETLRKGQDKKDKVNGAYVHSILNTLGVAGLIAGLVIIERNKASHPETRFQSIHGKMGLVAYILILIQWLVGF